MSNEKEVQQIVKKIDRHVQSLVSHRNLGLIGLNKYSHHFDSISDDVLQSVIEELRALKYENIHFQNNVLYFEFNPLNSNISW